MFNLGNSCIWVCVIAIKVVRMGDGVAEYGIRIIIVCILIYVVLVFGI